MGGAPRRWRFKRDSPEPSAKGVRLLAALVCEQTEHPVSDNPEILSRET